MTSWLPHQQAILAPPDSLTTTEWAERNVQIPARLSPLHHGPYSCDVTPYMREIQDVMADAEHEWVVVKKAVQTGGSQATRNALLRWLTRRPAPILLVYPDEESAKHNMDRKVIPALRGTKRTKAMISGRKWDTKRKRVSLTVTDLVAGWSGSAQSLASDPFCYVICDEVDKFAPFAGRDADAISLAARRTTTFGKLRKIVLISTPTTSHGQIARAFESCADKRDYWLQCQHCKNWFLPAYSCLQHERKHDDHEEEAAYLEAEQPVVLVCPECGAIHEEKEKPALVRAGEWRTRGGPVDSVRVGFHVSGIVSLIGPSWSDIVARHVRALGDYAALMDFFNNDLGEEFEDTIERIKSVTFETKRDAGYAPGIVPKWGAVLIASADTQKDYFWWMVRAWGRGGVSRLLAYGRAESFAELYDRTLRYRWQVEGTTTMMRARCLLIDSGGTRHEGEDASNTEKVYRFTKTDPTHIWPCRGYTGGTRPVKLSNVTYTPPKYRASMQVLLRVVNTEYFKDVLASNIRAKDVWQEHKEIDENYARQMTSEHKVARRHGNTIKMAWLPLSQGTPNHLWDAAVLQCAGAYMLESDTLPPEEVLEGERKRRGTPGRFGGSLAKKRKGGRPWVDPRRRSRR